MKNLKNYIPYIILYIVLLVVHLRFGYHGDDLVYKAVVENQQWEILLNEVIHRYFAWSSRCLIDFNVLLFTYIPIIIWQVLNPLIIVGMAIIIPKLFSDKESLKNNCISTVLILILYSLIHQCSGCGAIATNLNYTWPLFFLILNLFLVKRYILKEDVILSNLKKALVYILLIFSLLFACNHEQVLIATGLIYLFIIVYEFRKNDSFNKALLFMFLLIVLSAVFILTCPGNFIRLESEIIHWWPEFAGYDFFNKLNIGITATFRLFIGNGNIVTLLFLLVFAGYNYKISKNKWLSNLITAIPFLIAIIMQIIIFFNSDINVFLGSKISYTLFSSSMNLVFDAIYLIMVICILYGFYNIYKNKGFKTVYLLFTLLLTGVITSIVIGFTPTMFTSLSRMYLTFEAIMCVITYYMLTN